MPLPALPPQPPTLRVVPLPADANASGDIFGGWIMSQVDMAGAIAAIRRARGRVVTVAVNAFQFKQPVLVGDVVSLYAQVTRIGRSSLTVDVAVFAERGWPHIAAGDQIIKVTEATLTYVAIDDERRPRPVPADPPCPTATERIMDPHWCMLSVIGADRPGIVARLSGLLYEAGCNLGEASMVRLGGNFAIMLMVETRQDPQGLEALLAPLARDMGLRLHLDTIDARLHAHVEPNLRLTVHGADRAGIVAEITAALAGAGCNILDLNSDVAGEADRPLYIMIIEAHAPKGMAAVEAALTRVRQSGIDVRVQPLETLLG